MGDWRGAAIRIRVLGEVERARRLSTLHQREAMAEGRLSGHQHHHDDARDHKHHKRHDRALVMGMKG